MALAKDTDVRFGKHDDGRDGVVLTKIAQGELVRVPFPALTGLGQAGTSSAATLTNLPNNPDGSYSGISLNAAQLDSPLSVGGVAYVRCIVYGRVVGIRWRRISGAPDVPFTVAIDGVVYPVRNVAPRRHTQIISTVNDHEALFVVADDLLSDGPHTVEIGLASPPNGSATRSLTLYGLLVEASKGYDNYRKGGYVYTTSGQAVTTTATAIGSNGVARKFMFYNSDTTNDRLVTINSATGVVFRTLVVPATNLASGKGGYAEHDFGQSVPIDSNWKVSVDTGTTVKMFVMQGEPAR